METNPLSHDSWHQFYSQSQQGARYPTEWVVRTLAGGDYPHLKMNKAEYKGSPILDLSCGDGRNLPLLIDLKFDVHATEVTQPQVDQLVIKADELCWPVQFSVASNVLLPFPDRYFKYLLACSSMYYLDGDSTWESVLSETARILSDDGWLIGNIPDSENSVLRDAEFLSDGSAIIRNDPFAIRDGVRFMVAENEAEVRHLLKPEFEVVSIGHQHDNFFGLMVSGFFFVAQRKSAG